MTQVRANDREAADARERNLEMIRRLKNRIRDQNTNGDLRNNYLYWIMFNNWKKKKGALGDPPKGEWGMPKLEREDDRTRRDEWTGLDTNQVTLTFPDVDEIDKMDIKIDMFDVERYNSVNDERIGNIKTLEKENYKNKDGNYDLEKMDDKLFKALDPKEKKEFDYKRKLIDR